MPVNTSYTIAPQSGDSLILKKGQFLKVTDPKGEQVSDMLAFSKDDISEHLSAGKTLDFESSMLITTGNHLWSNRSRKMLEIMVDTNGRNDFLLAPCSPETFQILYDDHSDHPSCQENLLSALKDFGVKRDMIPTAFNIFMNVQWDEKGQLRVEPPQSKAGDHIIFRACIDLIIGLTACSAEQSNNGSFKPIEWQVLGEKEAVELSKKVAET